MVGLDDYLAALLDLAKKRAAECETEGELMLLRAKFRRIFREMNKALWNPQA